MFIYITKYPNKEENIKDRWIQMYLKGIKFELSNSQNL